MASLLKPLRFRFTVEDDIAQFGSDWHIYDEAGLVSLPARTLMAYEREIGVPIPDVMNGVRASSAFGDMAGSWLALRLELGESAPPFAAYNPIVMKIEWEPVPTSELEPGKEEADSGQDQPETPPTTVDPLGSDPGPAVSPSPDILRTATVSLPTLPVSA